MADLFFILNNVDIASYAVDNTPYVIADDINGVITSLEQTSKALFEWFENNLLKSNTDKCHLLVSSTDAVNLRVSEYDIKNSECEKLLGVKFDNKLTFEKRITDICGKASRKIYALARIAPYMDLSKRRMVMNAFFEMYKVSNGLSPPIASNIFTQKNCHPYNLRLNSQFSRPLVRSVFHGTDEIADELFECA